MMNLAKALSVVLGLCVAACGAESSTTSQGERVVVADSFVCNGMDAREVLSQIAQHGAVFTNQREAVFYFYGEESNLPAFQSELEKLEFTVRPTSTEPGRIATITRIIDEQWLAETMRKICALTATHGVEYDGWEASIPEAQSK